MDIGAFKVVFDRARSYAQLPTQAMVFYLFLESTGWHWWYLMIVPLFVAWLIYDTKRVIGKERDFIWTRPGELKDLIQNVKDIKAIIKNG